MNVLVEEPTSPTINFKFGDDQLLNAQYILESDFKFICELTNGLEGKPPTEQQKSLDTLISLMNIGDMLRNEISLDYAKAVSELYNRINLCETLNENDLTTNLKFVKLINICTDKCPTQSYPKINLLSTYLLHIIDYFRDFSNQKNKQDRTSNNTDINNDLSLKVLISELLFFFLLNMKNKQFDIEINFKFYLEDLIFLLVNKYINNLNFKYSLKVKIPGNKILKSPRSRANSRASSSTSSLQQHSSVTPTESRYPLKYELSSNKGITLANAIPNPVMINNVIERTILSRSLVLYTTTRTTNPEFPSILWKNQHIMLFVSSLLKYPDIELSLASLKFLVYPIIYSKNVYKNDKQSLTKCLPYLFQSLDYDYIPFWFDPFKILTRLMNLYNEEDPAINPVTIYIENSNSYEPFLDLLSKSIAHSSENESISETSIRMIQLWASIAAFDERTRCTVISIPNILTRLGKDIKSHIDLLNEFTQYYLSITSTDLDSKENLTKFPPLYDSRLVLSWLHLLKSFSRSVTALRTKLQKAHLTETLTKLLNSSYILTKVAYNVGGDFLKKELEIMGLTLGNICNFMVEFSSLQASVLQTDILGTIKEILDDNLFNPNTEKNLNQERTAAFKGLNLEGIKTYALWVLRHLMYNCPNSEKMKLLERIPFDIILDFINDPSWPVQEQCFQLVRNLTCNSRRVVNLLLEKFKYAEYKTDPTTGIKKQTGSTYLFEYLARKMRLLDMRNKSQRKTLEAILYIINNIAAVNENKKKLVVEQDEILDILKDILAESSQNSSKYGNDSELKLASLWVLNNLLWNSSLSTYTQYVLEGYSATAGNNYNGSSTNSSSSEESIYISNHPDEPKPFTATRGRSSSSEGNQSSFSSFSGNNEDDTHDNEDKEFIHPYGTSTSNNNTSSVHANDSTVERCKKLSDIGLYALVKQNIFDESLDVREKARTLLYHMDLLLKSA